VRRLPAIATAVLLSSALSLASATAASAGTEAARTGTASASQGQSGGVYIGRHPNPPLCGTPVPAPVMTSQSLTPCHHCPARHRT
jgi:hypothetical protein